MSTKYDFLVEMPMTGVCKIDIDKLLKQWDDKFVIYGRKDEEEYRLSRRVLKGNTFKYTISKEDAYKIISKLGLIKCTDDFFKQALTYCSIAYLLDTIKSYHRERSFELAKDTPDMGKIEHHTRKIEHYKKFI